MNEEIKYRRCWIVNNINGQREWVEHLPKQNCWRKKDAYCTSYYEADVGWREEHIIDATSKPGVITIDDYKSNILRINYRIKDKRYNTAIELPGKYFSWEFTGLGFEEDPDEEDELVRKRALLIKCDLNTEKGLML